MSSQQYVNNNWDTIYLAGHVRTPGDPLVHIMFNLHGIHYLLHNQVAV